MLTLLSPTFLDMHQWSPQYSVTHNPVFIYKDAATGDDHDVFEVIDSVIMQLYTISDPVRFIESTYMYHCIS